MKTVVSIIFIIAAGLLFFLYTSPTYSSTDLLKARIAGYEDALQNAANLRQIKEETMEKYNRITKEQQQDLSKLIPDTVDNIKLIIDIDRMAKQRNLEIKNIRIDQGSADPKTASTGSTAKTDGGQGTITLSFSVNATYDNIVTFLKDLESSLRIVDVTNFGFQSSTVSNQYDFTITFKTYWLK